MKVALASDHAGFEAKKTVLQTASGLGHDCDDLGPATADRTDYPDWAKAVATQVASGRADRGILVCGTGIGMCIAANKVPGIRAAVCWDVSSARLAREHNNSNILCISGRLFGPELITDIVKTWLETPFSEGERHIRRIELIAQMDQTTAKEA